MTAAALAVPATAGNANLQLTPVGRVPFPERAFVLDLPKQVNAANLHVDVRENGKAVSGVTVKPVGASGIRFGAVLAVDSSESMTGEPFAAALEALRSFVQHRAPTEKVGILTFNSQVHMVQPLTANSSVLNAAIARRPGLAYGTHIFDGVERALTALEQAKISAGSIVLLSDGADVGSKATLEKAIARAQRDRVRIFAVGIRSGAFEALPLNRLASETGGSFIATTSTSQLARIYGEISGRLANEYLLEYRSSVSPGTPVQVTAGIGGLGAGATQYTAPTPSGLKPFHRSLVSRFLLSPVSLVLMSILAAVLVGGGLLSLLRLIPENDVAARIGAFVGSTEQAQEPTQRRRYRRAGTADSPGLLARWWARLEGDFELGEIMIAPRLFIVAVCVGTVLAAIILTSLAGPLILLAPLVPVFAFAWVRRRVKRVRDAFADQLPETLQLLASALRSGHSLIGALKVVVENAPEPTRREFGQVVTDDQIGLPIDDSARKVAERMRSRDMVQVALIAELQRTAGGNAADVLDTVVATVRERAEVRRLARTLTAQGRMARWILSILPIVLALLMLVLEPKITKPLFESTGGQIAIVFSALLVVVGSFWIQQVVEIEV
jgi:tight adherence protein B